jgi:hypothetical protein
METFLQTLFGLLLFTRSSRAGILPYRRAADQGAPAEAVE